MKEIRLSTGRRTELIDITGRVQDAVAAGGASSGLCVVYVPHTTAGVTINEGADPAVRLDIAAQLDRLVPWDNDYGHLEGNAAAHIKATLTGSSVVIMIEKGRPVLGTWQSVYFCEFDGPRSRRVAIRIFPAPAPDNPAT